MWLPKEAWTLSATSFSNGFFTDLISESCQFPFYAVYYLFSMDFPRAYFVLFLECAGLEDLRWGKPDLSRVLKATQGEPGEVRLLLSHRPEVFPDAARRGLEVVLSGHYHGGQVKLTPGQKGLSIARLITPYAEGLFHLSRRFHASGAGAKDAVLFVGRGIGITGLPIRINRPPQIAHLTLRRA